MCHVWAVAHALREIGAAALAAAAASVQAAWQFSRLRCRRRRCCLFKHRCAWDYVCGGGGGGGGCDTCGLAKWAGARSVTAGRPAAGVASLSGRLRERIKIQEFSMTVRARGAVCVGSL